MNHFKILDRSDDKTKYIDIVNEINQTLVKIAIYRDGLIEVSQHGLDISIEQLGTTAVNLTVNQMLITNVVNVKT